MRERQQNGHYPVFSFQMVENTNFRAEGKDIHPTGSVDKEKEKAVCSILHFYSNHQVSHLKYKNENKLHSNAQ